MPYEHFISNQEPKRTCFCISCHQKLHAPFMICAATDRGYLDPPDEEWICYECSKDDEVWNNIVFCATCDKQTNGEEYCSQKCSEYETLE